MDYNKKRDEILAVWEDLFAVCKGIVKRVKSGKADINASLLKEVNGFLRLSLELIERNIAEEEEKRKDEEATREMEENLPEFDDDDDLPSFDDAPMSCRLKTDTLEF